MTFSLRPGDPDFGDSLHVSPGETLMRQGDPEGRLFIIDQGAAEVWRAAKTGGRWKLSDLGPGDIVGEVEAIDGEPALATVRAVDAVVCRAASHAAVVAALDQLDPLYQFTARRLARMLRENYQVYTEGMALSLFGGGAVSALADSGEERAFEPGDTLMRQGDAPDAMYVVVSGLVEVARDEEADQPRKLVELGRGCLVGEIEMIDLIPRNATVTALKPTITRRIDADSFRAGLDSVGMLKDAMFSMTHALRRSNEILAKPARP
ncbi:MAG: cyclic nucleotide-binding domain-containing protein [Pseudomonadota bacterium]